MKMIQEPAKKIPIIHECDILVVGGSCTGVFATVRAARLGARVAIIEQQNCFGGVATNGLVNVWHSLHDTIREKQIIAGLTQEVIEKLLKRNAVILTDHKINAHYLNTEELKIELDELIIEHNITPFLHTFYAAPHVEDGILKAVIVENKTGRGAIAAKVFVDATGDADLCLDLNLSSYIPDTLQPPTSCAKIYGLSTDGGDVSYAGAGVLNWDELIDQHGEEFNLKKDWGWRAIIPGLPNITMHADTHVFDVDTSNADDLTLSEIEGRRQIRAMMDIFRKYGPPDQQITLAALASHIGARETKRIIGNYRLTGEDVLNGRKFEDAIGYGSYRVDIHHSDSPGITFRYLDGSQVTIPRRGQEKIVSCWRDAIPEDPTYYQIPYRCLVPGTFDNLIMAGRMLDADKEAFSAARVMVNMNQTGEAAGVAAWLALDSEKSISEVDIKKLRKILSDGGSIIY